MSAIKDILQQLPIDRLAGELSVTPEEVEQAASVALPALLGGLAANAQDPDGATSIEEALGQHPAALVEGGVDVTQVDTADGARIAQHIFGDHQDQVVQQLGGIEGSGGTGLVKQIVPILAPIVLSYLAGQLGRRSNGSVDTVLSEVLRDTLQGTSRGGASAGSIIADLLGGLLGAGRR